MKNFAVLFFLLFSINAIKAQISRDVQAPSWPEASGSAQPLIAIDLPVPDLQALRIEDSIEAKYKDIPWRFATAIDSSIDVVQISNRQTFNGMIRIQLLIKAQDAKSINLNFDRFYLPSSAALYLRSLKSKDRLGALGAHNNKADSAFSCRPLRGDEIMLELYLDENDLEDLELRISQVIYGYRDVFAKTSKTFNSSGSCNRNTNCPEAGSWQDVKRSVVLITASNNTRLCTGTLINNVKQDSIPYLLTAAHCNLATNSIFIFNYENSSNDCLINVDGSLTNSISGAFSRASSFYSDFKLFELSQKPPASYKVYYAGWDASGVPALEATSIHHPSGDIKKISRDKDTLMSSFYSPPNINTHWQVGNWESGTTEPGSSGAALFDQLKRVVGQLEGGSANCSNELNDYFGKFSLSWDRSSAANQQLQFWLDPDTTNQRIMDGFDPLPKSNNRDVELTYVKGVPALSCDSTINPTVYFLNKGNDTITNLQISYGTNQQLNQTVNWTGNLITDEVGELVLPAYALAAADSIFNVRLILSSGDQDTSNNSWGKSIKANLNSLRAYFVFNTDQYGYENRWEIIDQQSQEVILKGGPYVESLDTTGYTFRDSICLYDGCFILRIYDSFGDGFNGSFYGNGYARIVGPFGDTLVYEANFTSSQKSLNFCLRDSSTFLKENNKKGDPKLYPNPVAAGERVFGKDIVGLEQIRLYDLQGRIIREGYSFPFVLPNNIETGIYLVEITDQDGQTARTKLMVEN